MRGEWWGVGGDPVAWRSGVWDPRAQMGDSEASRCKQDVGIQGPKSAVCAGMWLCDLWNTSGPNAGRGSPRGPAPDSPLPTRTRPPDAGRGGVWGTLVRVPRPSLSSFLPHALQCSYGQGWSPGGSWMVPAVQHMEKLHKCGLN